MYYNASYIELNTVKRDRIKKNFLHPVHILSKGNFRVGLAAWEAAGVRDVGLGWEGRVRPVPKQSKLR